MTSRIEQLMKLCMQEEASEAERSELLRLLQAAENEGEAKSLINEALEGATSSGVEVDVPASGDGLTGEREGVQGNGGDMSEGVSAAVLEAIFQADAADRKKVRRIVWRRVAYAAAIVLVIAAGMVVAFVKKKPASVGGIAPKQNIVIVKDIPPGGNKAVLTLADGATISLDDCKKGDVARDGNAQIVKGGDSGTLIYHAVSGDQRTMSGDQRAMSGNQRTMAYNTITTPRGGQYQLTLADGSKVWLNASSSLHFPTTFGNAERVVELTGEGYFEIAGNTAKPFSISVNGVRVQVLGTHFNINAYHDERVVRTTLIEGAVKVESGGQAVLLRPGQQAVAGGAEASLRIAPDADLEEVMAWKEGIFNFKNLDIESIMRQISRWYDVEVVYAGGKKPEGHFSGMISRNTPALTVLKMLEYGGVRFTIESKKIVIGNQ